MNMSSLLVGPPHESDSEISEAQPKEMASAPDNLWAVILAGEGATPRSAAGHTFEDRRLKRDSAPRGSQALLRQTLNRVRLAIPLGRTVIVTNRSRPIRLAPENSVPDAPRLSIQLQAGGTATSVLLAVHWIQRQDSGASVAVFPSEQLVLEPLAFMQHVVKVAHFVGYHDREIVLLGARPTDPDTHYEWIEMAQRISGSAPDAIRRVKRLWGQTSSAVARACYDSGYLWNTSVIVARADALLRASRRALPELDSRVETAAALEGTRYEQRALEECYRLAGQANFSESILAAVPHLLSVSRLPKILWSDVGGRERVFPRRDRSKLQQPATRNRAGAARTCEEPESGEAGGLERGRPVRDIEQTRLRRATASSARIEIGQQLSPNAAGVARKPNSTRPSESRIDQILEQSFPASDPPSWTLGL